MQLNVDVTSLIELPVGRGVALRAVLSDGNLDLHKGLGYICENCRVVIGKICTL